MCGVQRRRIDWDSGTREIKRGKKEEEKGREEKEAGGERERERDRTVERGRRIKGEREEGARQKR